MGRDDRSLSSRDDDEPRRSKKKKSKKRKHDDDASSEPPARKKKKSKDRKRKKSKKRRRYSTSSSGSSSSDTNTNDQQQQSLVANERLQQKLLARGETLEERKARRAQKRAAHIANKFGYTADANPFNDPNLHEKFTWKKAVDRKGGAATTDAFDEIEKVRNRRTERDNEMIERERARAEESRMREQEHFQDWATKEEAFHLQQQRQRSAIRLVEGREKPIDVLAKNILMFGLTDQEQTNRARVKYQERYSALDEIKSLEGELEEPAELLKVLKLDELKELRLDVLDFFRLEKEAITHGQNDDRDRPSTTVMDYWGNVRVLVENEINQLETKGETSKVSTAEVCSIFVGQSDEDLHKMETEVATKLQNPAEEMDRSYWMLVLDQLSVHFARIELSRMHARMLVRQLEKLEAKKVDLALQKANGEKKPKAQSDAQNDDEGKDSKIPTNVELGFGDEEAEGTEEVDLVPMHEGPENTRRLRKPRYFNRVRTGYDWNKYNQTHYDQDNPPPKTVQGYKFNIFYPELDPTISPQFSLEAADTNEFCIIRFTAGPPYEDIAFKIVNREWNRSRKKGFKCTFERGILSLYFNFTTFWYRK